MAQGTIQAQWQPLNRGVGLTNVSTENGTAPGRKAFLSHSSKDLELTERICHLLEAQGVPCWVAPRDVLPGRPYAEECVRGIEVSESFVLLASDHAVSSVQVMAEVEQAHKRRKPLYTILIGKPAISKELDYYISRLHWIESAGSSTEGIADKLAGVLNGQRSWPEVSAAPSLRRTLTYRRDVFLGAAFAVLAVLLVAGAGLWYWAHQAMRQLDVDFRSLGQVTFSAPGHALAPDNAIQLPAQVWVLAEGVRFGDARLVAASRNQDGRVAMQDFSSTFRPEQVGSVEVVDIRLPAGARAFTTCLSVPSPRRKQRYRVAQDFSLSPADGAFVVTRVAEPRVSVDDGKECGPGAP